MSIKRIFLLLFIVSTLFSMKGYAQLSILPLINNTKRTIVVMGSSSAFGWHTTVPDSTWVNRLQKDLHFYGRSDTIINIAFPGNTTYVCLPTGSPHPGYAPASDPAYNVTTALSYNPTFVIISLPTNDIADGYSDAETLANYKTITDALIAAHVPFILTGTQPRDLGTDVGCSTAFDSTPVCLSQGGLSIGQQNDLGTFNGLLAAQYPATGPSGTPYNTPVVNNFLTLLSVSSSNFEINPTIGYGDGIHYVDNGHRIVYDTMVNFQYYKDLVCFTQTITMPGSISKPVGSADFTTGNASSGLALTYTSSDPSVATIVGGQIHIVGGAGSSCTITASQAGNQHYLAAPNVGVTLTITGGSGGPTTYDWTGAVSSDWQTAGNWQIAGVTATDYPGDGASTDIVDIGVNVSYTNNPVISSPMPNTIGSLTFGDNLITGSATTTQSLTVNSTVILNITGQLLQKHTTAGVLNSGNTAVVNAIQTYIGGAGTINCASVDIGDSTTPTADGVVNTTKMQLGAAVGGSTVTLNVTGNFILNTQSSDNGGSTLILSTNDAQFSLAAGTLTIGGQIQLTDGGATNFTVPNFQPASKFSIDLYNNSDSPVLNLQNATAITTQIGNVADSVDFYNIAVDGGTGVATVNYTGMTNQEVYNFVSGSTTASGIIDNSSSVANAGDGVVYENLGFGGSGTKTVDAPATLGTLLVGQTVTLNSGTETVDLSTNNSALLVGADFTTGTGSTLTCGLRPFIVYGSFLNSGTCNFGTAMVTFSSAGDNSMFTVNPQLLTNVTINGNGNETITGGQFNLASTGLLTISDTTTQLKTNGHLTLNSDANGSATIAAIPAGCSITGNVNVQRYISNHRAYRLASSPVYSSTVGANNIYSLNYITRSIYTTGTTATAGGFDKGGNPTIYLYRENLAPLYTTFLNSNFRGVNNIKDTLNYKLDVDTGVYNLPVGNGYMFYYRGSRRQDSLVALTTPGAASTTDTLTATGKLNQGPITVSNWFTPGSANLLYTKLSSNITIYGSNLVGNPYPSSIDWDQYSATDNTAGIYAPYVAPFAYQLIPTGAQGSGNYGVYEAKTGDTTGTNGATNIIGSGVGFFVQADSTAAQLVFNENAKTNTQAVVGSSLFMATHLTHTAINTTATNNQYLRLQLAKDSINADESLIRFDAKSTALFDPVKDAKYRLGTGAVSLSSLSTDNVALAIHRVPLPKNKQTRAIPLRLGANADGNYQLKLKAINQVPQLYDIWLKDKFLKDSSDMRKNASYSFAIKRADTNTYLGRFLITLREDPIYAYKLLSFGAGKIPRQLQVSVSWTSQYEGNYTSFTVERSNDNGNTFNAIGGFTSTGTGTYNLIDKTPSFGDNQYRLKQVDIDNNVTYSEIADVQIANKDNRTVCIYPNPASSVINLCIDTKTVGEKSFNIRISNSSGVLIKDVVSSTANWQANISNLLTGTYLVQIINKKDNSLVGEAKFVKL
ncbi:MAG: T9SS type A sorting domain-containing protein [Sphingobacteriales bacterium]